MYKTPFSTYIICTGWVKTLWLIPEEKSGDHQSHWDSSSGDPECLKQNIMSVHLIVVVIFQSGTKSLINYPTKTPISGINYSNKNNLTAPHERQTIQLLTSSCVALLNISTSEVLYRMEFDDVVVFLQLQFLSFKLIQQQWKHCIIDDAPMAWGTVSDVKNIKSFVCSGKGDGQFGITQCNIRQSHKRLDVLI